MVAYDTISTDLIVANITKSYSLRKSEYSAPALDGNGVQLKQKFTYGSFTWKQEKVFKDDICLHMPDRIDYKPSAVNRT